jgi:hypothetical protein
MWRGGCAPSTSDHAAIIGGSLQRIVRPRALANLLHLLPLRSRKHCIHPDQSLQTPLTRKTSSPTSGSLRPVLTSLRTSSQYHHRSADRHPNRTAGAELSVRSPNAGASAQSRHAAKSQTRAVARRGTDHPQIQASRRTKILIWQHLPLAKRALFVLYSRGNNRPNFDYATDGSSIETQANGNIKSEPGQTARPPASCYTFAKTRTLLQAVGEVVE